jgi:hypothetical protein
MNSIRSIGMFLALACPAVSMGACSSHSEKILYELAAMAASEDFTETQLHVINLQGEIANMTPVEIDHIDQSTLGLMEQFLRRTDSDLIVVGMAETLAQIGPKAKFALPTLRAVYERQPDDTGVGPHKVIYRGGPKMYLRQALRDLEAATSAKPGPPLSPFEPTQACS